MADVPVNTKGSRFYTITKDSSVAWDSRTVFPGGMRILSIEMAPAAASNAVVVRDVGAGTGVTGARIFSHVAIDTYDIAVRPYGKATPKGHFGQHCYPYIAAAESVGSYDITFELA